MRYELRFEGVFEAAPEEVFDAFTDSEVLAEAYEREDPAGSSSGREIWIDRVLRARARIRALMNRNQPHSPKWRTS